MFVSIYLTDISFLQATIPPNVDLLSSPQVHYTESFGLIPEPFPRSQQEQVRAKRVHGILLYTLYSLSDFSSLCFISSFFSF